MQAAFQADLRRDFVGMPLAMAILRSAGPLRSAISATGRSPSARGARWRSSRLTLAMRTLSEIDVTNAPDASARGIASTSVISPRYQLDSDVLPERSAAGPR